MLFQQSNIGGIGCNAIPEHNYFQVGMFPPKVFYESFRGVALAVVFCCTIPILNDLWAEGDYIREVELMALEELELFQAFSSLKFGEYFLKYRTDKLRVKFI